MNFFAVTLLIFLADLMAAPQLRHLERFPCITRNQWGAINGMNTQQQVKLWNIAILYPERHDLKDLAWDLEQRRQAWDALDNARHGYDINFRRVELARLMSIIGYEAFMMGRMPEPY